jgi:hypothetical protein
VKYLRSFGRLWWDLIIGDDWRLAAGVVAGLGVAALLAHRRCGVVGDAGRSGSDARLVAQARSAVTIGSRPMRVVR